MCQYQSGGVLTTICEEIMVWILVMEHNDYIQEALGYCIIHLMVCSKLTKNKQVVENVISNHNYAVN